MSDDTISRKKKLKMKKLKRKHRNKNKKRRHRQQRTKHDPSKGPPINCIVSKWSDWSSCSVTCGRGLVMKNRKIVTKDSNGGKPCPRKFIRKKKCKLPKCRKYLSTNIKLKNYITRSFLSRLVIVVLIINKGEVQSFLTFRWWQAMSTLINSREKMQINKMSLVIIKKAFDFTPNYHVVSGFLVGSVMLIFLITPVSWWDLRCSTFQFSVFCLCSFCFLCGQYCLCL